MAVQFKNTLPIVALCSLLSACGGGGSSDTSAPDTNTDTGSGWVEGEFAQSDTFKNQCNALDEKFWLRSWSHETYLWYDEITDRDPASVSDVIDYFNLLVTTQTTDSGAQKDNFHFSMDTSEWQQQQQSGAAVSYGFNFQVLQSAPPREVVVTYNEPNTPASEAGVERGWEIVEVNGVDVVNGSDVDTINNGLFPSATNTQTEFTFRLRDSNEQRTLTLTAQSINEDPVMNVKTLSTGSGNVGYLQFNSHNAPAERQLYDAFNTLAQSDVNDLVIDMRYNGGGLLVMAAQLGYMIAGSSNTQDVIFEKTIFNDKYPTTNPVTGETLTPYPFIDQYVGFDPDSGISAGTALPSLNLDRVFVLSTASTCSASEALVNGLRGIPSERGFEVVLIGSGTCGKPYGFYPTDNCDTTYFTIQFTGVNNQGFGEYSDGFAPSNSTALTGSPVLVQGCAVADDFNHLLGDNNEALLAAALQYKATGSCPNPSSLAGLKGYALKSSTPSAGMGLSGDAIGDTRARTHLESNRIMTPVPQGNSHE